jgi:hypothetical protein
MAQILKQKRLTNPAALAEIRQMACIVCRRRPVDAAHIKSKGSGGPDEMANLMPLCRTHHQMQHAQGHIFMIEKFPTYKFFLLRLGWSVQDLHGRKTIHHLRYG